MGGEAKGTPSRHCCHSLAHATEHEVVRASPPASQPGAGLGSMAWSPHPDLAALPLAGAQAHCGANLGTQGLEAASSRSPKGTCSNPAQIWYCRGELGQGNKQGAVAQLLC